MKKGSKKGTAGSRETALRLWDLVNLYPRVSDEELEKRLSDFIINATEEELFAMSRELFEFATSLIKEDEKLRRLMASMQGRCLALIIDGSYHSVVTFQCDGFELELRRDDDLPALIAASREVYRDAALKRKDPTRLILERKIRARKLPKMVRWTLPHLKVLRNRALYDRYLSRQEEIEAKIEETLTRLGY